MTEDEARGWTEARFGRTITEQVGAFLAMVIAEAPHQNLVAPSTIPTIWSRHAVDSLQLIDLAGDGQDLWIDIGTGGGFPGLVIALARPGPMILVEPRRRRADFLSLCIARLGLGERVVVRATKIEAVTEQGAVISARAVASLENLLHAASHCATKGTRWLLPRGRLDDAELDALRQTWRFMFHVEHSVTNAESSIVVLDGVSAR